ncbi:tetratricopeptide repeat protein [Sphingobacterium olei]|uniref:Tetratricopeptide repeat protein n=1 Tax=Sphingobacterium olei TaxID=2571155 RepID=A0A4U0NYM9_9SPHI|nr:tetratricopeptide repeat protein [Sphingobacterium olei]TJZ59976.1 tetratricopeptide repeat protein [Sphingobacterium olei]
MNKYFYFFFFMICALSSTPAFGQTDIDSVVLKLQTAKADSTKVKLLQKAGLYYKTHDLNKAANYLDEAIKLAEKINWDKGLSHTLLTRGEIFNESGKHEEATEHYNNALKIATKINDKKLIAQILNNIGTVHAQKTEEVEAMEFYSRSLQIAEEINDKELIALGFLNLGIIASRQNDLKKSNAYTLKALKIYEQKKDWAKVAQTLNGIGLNYQSEGNIPEAEKYLYKALRLYEKENNKTGVAILYSQIAILYEPDYQKIITLQLKSKKIWDEVNPTHFNAMVNLGNLGYTYLNLYLAGATNKLNGARDTNLRYAESFIQEAIELAKSTKNKEFESYFTGTLAEVQEQQGDFKNAYFNFREFHESNDSLYSQEIKNKISNIQSEREIALRDKQIALANLKMKSFWLYGIIISITLIAVFMYFLNRYRLNQLSLKNDIVKKEAEKAQEVLLFQNKITESELKAIRSQMNPHFIFNVLNNIESYILENEPKTASRLIQKFAMLNRLVLENSTQSMVKIAREWKALQLYTELEAIRFNNQFTYHFEVDETIDMEKLMIPPMLAQPLVENAIHHGLRHSTAAEKQLHVKLVQDEIYVKLIVIDNGIGLQQAKKHTKPSEYKEKSIGLESIKERLEILNRNFDAIKSSLEVKEKDVKEGKGTISQIWFPKIYAD